MFYSQNSLMHSFLVAGLLAVGTAMAANEVSCELVSTDPLHPDRLSQTNTVVMGLDARGFPEQYRLLLQTEVCLDQVCKPLTVTLFWDALGQYLRMECPEGVPLTKENHNKFTQKDYDQLDAILKDRGSVLGVYPLSYFTGSRVVRVVTVDAVTSATPTELRYAVVPEAAYTSWVLWRWVNGEIPERLRALTLTHSSVDYLLYCLRLNDPRFSRFAVRYFEQISELRPPITKQLADQLVVMSSYFDVHAVLNILEKNGRDDLEVRRGVEKLLDSKNRFIARRAEEFLSRSSNKLE